MDSSDASTAALCLGVGLLLVYNVTAYALQKTGLRLALRANPAWAQRHLDEAGAPETTLAIQTLRNTVLVATFVGTLVFGQAVLALNTVAPATVTQEKVRVVLQAALQVASFLSFASVIRTAQHIGYMVGGAHELQRRAAAERKAAAAAAAAANAAAASAAAAAAASVAVAAPATAAAPAGVASPPLVAAGADAEAAAAAADADTDAAAGAGDEESLAEIEASVHNLVRTQAWSFSLGFRFLYCSLPFTFGVAGAVVLIVAAVAILCFLVYVDHAHEPCCVRCSGGRSARSRRGGGGGGGGGALLGGARAAAVPQLRA